MNLAQVLIAIEIVQLESSGNLNLRRIVLSLNAIIQIEAVFAIEAALELDPANYRIYEGLGYMYMRMENKKKAEEAFLKSIELGPDVAWNYYNLACLHSVNGSSKKALEWH